MVARLWRDVCAVEWAIRDRFTRCCFEPVRAGGGQGILCVKLCTNVRRPAPGVAIRVEFDSQNELRKMPPALGERC